MGQHSARSPRSAIFIALDGVICDRDVTDNDSWEARGVVPGALEGLQLLGRLELPIIVLIQDSQASHDSAVRKRSASPGPTEGTCLGALLKSSDVQIESLLVYPAKLVGATNSHEDLRRQLAHIAKSLHLDLPTSFLIGDCWAEIESAAAVGCQPIMTLAGQGSEQILRPQTKAVRALTWYVTDLPMAALSIEAQLVAYQAQSRLGSATGAAPERGSKSAKKSHSQTVA